MRILVVNDDGITNEGIERLARMAAQLGEVWVVAPDDQCSAMSQRITIRGEIFVHEHPEFPVEGVHAYSVSGTPADCVKIAVKNIMKEKPDIVFSGINQGYNMGRDIAYSGTVHACMEALFMGVPAIAYSYPGRDGSFEIAENHMLSLTREIMLMPIEPYEMWNINFPGIPESECKGVLWDRVPEPSESDALYYVVNEEKEGYLSLTPANVWLEPTNPDSDQAAVEKGYIAIGKLKNQYLMNRV